MLILFLFRVGTAHQSLKAFIFLLGMPTVTSLSSLIFSLSYTGLGNAHHKSYLCASRRYLIRNIFTAFDLSSTLKTGSFLGTLPRLIGQSGLMKQLRQPFRRLQTHIR